MGRKRGQRRKRRQTRSVHVSLESLQAQEQAWIEQEEHLRRLQDEQRQEQQTRITQLRVRNVPFQATVEELVKCIERITGPQSVLKCRLNRARKPRLGDVNGGIGNVELASSDKAQLLLERYKRNIPIQMMGGGRMRDLKVEADPPRTNSDLAKRCISFEDAGVDLCNFVTSSKLRALWSVCGADISLDAARHELSFAFPLDQRRIRMVACLRDVTGFVRIIDSSPGTSLVVCLKHPPKVFRKIERASEDTGDSSALEGGDDYFSLLSGIPAALRMIDVAALLNYSLRDEDAWKRTGDFTQNGSVGGARVYHLRLQQGLNSHLVENLIRSLQHMKLLEHPFMPSSRKFLPVSAFDVQVSAVEKLSRAGVGFEVLFRLECLLSSGILCEQQLHEEGGLESIEEGGLESIEVEFKSTTQALVISILDSILKGGRGPPISSTDKSFKDTFISLKEQLSDEPEAAPEDVPPNHFMVKRVAITPTRAHAYGPEIEESNRVLREFAGKDGVEFLRLSFTEEDLSNLAPAGGSQYDVSDLIERIRHTLTTGIRVAGCNFAFLAFSSSQLKDRSCWFVSTTGPHSVESIRRWMGDFRNERCIAKCAARMGQCFSTTVPGPKIAEYTMIPDVERNNFCFSDGAGTISPELASELSTSAGADGSLRVAPSAFQIRFAGFKGVVSVDVSLTGRRLCLRKSQQKFQSTARNLDVCQPARFLPCFLNRQLIVLLKTNHVPDAAFEKLLNAEILEFDRVLKDKTAALKMLGKMWGSADTEFIEICEEMLEAGFHPLEEPFLRRCLSKMREQKLRDLRQRSRILVPQACSLMGVMDETGTLEYGQVFVQYQAPGCDAQVVIGRVLVGKNPCFHAGDVRVLQAVDSSRLRHLCNVVVFPSKGPRPHPNECSGSDLDGDIYSIVWDQDLLPAGNQIPMDYTPPKPALAAGEAVTISEIIEFFIHFFRSDNLGMIANAHLAHADLSLSQGGVGAKETVCEELAHLHSMAVDFAKTGVPAEFGRHLRAKKYPDFMEKEDKSGDEVYISESVIGRMYREVRYLEGSLRGELWKEGVGCDVRFHDDLKVSEMSDFLEEAHLLKNDYDFELLTIMHRYGVDDEVEAVSGQVSRFFSPQLRGKRGKIHEVRLRMQSEIRHLLKTYKHKFEENLCLEPSEMSADFGKGKQPDIDQKKAAQKAAAWYFVTYGSGGKKGDGDEKSLISFAWIGYKSLCMIKRSRTECAKQPMTGSMPLMESVPTTLWELLAGGASSHL